MRHFLRFSSILKVTLMSRYSSIVLSYLRLESLYNMSSATYFFLFFTVFTENSVLQLLDAFLLMISFEVTLNSASNVSQAY